MKRSNYQNKSIEAINRNKKNRKQRKKL